MPQAEFAARFRSKGECYTFLTQDVKAYCPPKDTVTTLYLRDMAMGRKRYIRCDNIRHLFVPHYESLSLEKIIGFVEGTAPDLLVNYFPIPREMKKFPR